MLGKDIKYGGVVLGKNRFNNDIPLCYHEISLKFIQLHMYSYMSSYEDQNQRRF